MVFFVILGILLIILAFRKPTQADTSSTKCLPTTSTTLQNRFRFSLKKSNCANKSLIATTIATTIPISTTTTTTEVECECKIVKYSRCGGDWMEIDSYSVECPD